SQGVPFQYLYPNMPWLAEISFYIFPALAGVTGLIFQRVFLHTKEHLPRLAKFIHVFTIAYIASSVIGIGFDHTIGYHIMQFTAMAVSLYLLVTSIILAKRGMREAKFFLVAWSFFLMGVILFILKDNGVLPYNAFTKNAMQIGSALEVILLSIALADKINTYKKQNEESQRKSLEVLQENERIVREQNVILEEKVKERTVELEESNSELNETLSELRQTQAQLVDAEKMASLGQMTAGIAHELNNPINFVSSNITPLKRDIRDVFEILDKYEELKDGENIRLKLDEVEGLKEELEIGFIRKEIDQLLQGINEGAERTSEIVKGLRVFSRLDEGALKKASMNECLDSTLVILKSNLKGECTLVKEYEIDLPLINCFPGKLNQVFMNIITNGAHAAKASGKPREERMVKVQTKSTDEAVIVSIADNGVGIPEDVKSRIFDPFFTTKEVGEGTGLGLSIVLGIINDHNGSITVNSTVGQGTEFVITLPKDL
ncbi:MAG: GHKL domain-containing protein, partial [Flavobacteriales bacterium]|nr:GHKL domain-containing protein [Flavobacteriales bacterium]